MANAGKLDLGDVDFRNTDVLSLDGEWEFYPGRLLDHDSFGNVSAPGAAPNEERAQEWINVPGSWSQRTDVLGKATYRLQILVNDDTLTYGLKTLSIQMANRILVNGTEVGSSGNVSDKPAYRSLNKPYTVYFSLNKGWNEIIVQAANYDLRTSSGIMNSIMFGSSAHIARLRDVAIIHDMLSICCFIIMGLYFIGLYSQRKSDYSLLYFGLLCVFVALFLSTRGERMLLVLVGDVPFWLYIRLQLVSVFIGGLMLLLYLYSAFRAYCSKRLIFSCAVLEAVLALGVLGFIDDHATVSVQMLTTGLGTLPFFYSTFVFILASLNRVEGSLYLVVAAIMLNYHAMMQSFNVYTNAPLYLTLPFEAFLVLLMLALMMSLRFSNAFKKIEQLSVQLINMDKLKDEFLSRTTHELKTPLHSVLTISQSMIADRKHPLPVEQKEKLEIVQSVVKRLSQLVLDILDLSRLKQGDLSVHLVPVDVHSTVEIVLRVFAFMTTGKDVQLINSVPRNLPCVLADENRFRQILNNLLDNAVKHTDVGSIEVSAVDLQGEIEISVIDTGEGIDEASIGRIFEPFQTFEQSDSRSFGLGLPIVKQLVELQRGTLSVVSRKGQGTVFSFRLPSASSQDDAVEHPVRSGAVARETDYSFSTPYYVHGTDRATILVADDDYANLTMLIDTLRPLGYNLIAVKNGFEAIEQIEGRRTIDLAVLDLMMPGMSGYEVCRSIRRQYTLLEMPVLMLTTAAHQSDKLAAFEAGANDFLSKPFDAMELKARIQNFMLMKDLLGKAIDLEVAFLQSQIKPHFLYNVLNTIIALSYTDEEQSRTLTVNLADYLRGSFRFSNLEKRVPFQQELNLIRSYVEIERIRFKDRLQIDYDIAVSIHSVYIPPLLIQPLVENAIRHGIGASTEGGRVMIAAEETEGHYRIRIEDNGVGIDAGQLKRLLDPEQELPQGVGLRNIMKRLKYEYNSTLSIDSSPGRGTRVIVLIPSVAKATSAM